MTTPFLQRLSVNPQYPEGSLMSKPTIVLVHGSFGDASSWRSVFWSIVLTRTYPMRWPLLMVAPCLLTGLVTVRPSLKEDMTYVKES